MGWNLQHYRALKEKLAKEGSIPRKVCLRCRKPEVTCFCHLVQSFSSFPQFVILIHPEEARRRIATGRMAHLCLSNSLMYEGINFSDHVEVKALLDDPEYHSVLLYPGKNSVDVSACSVGEVDTLFPPEKKLRVFILDATWAKARGMRRLSRILDRVPQVSFTPPQLSGFHVRRQPNQNCYSTIEAIHYFIDRLNPDSFQSHHNLIKVFSFMVRQQMAYYQK